MAISLAGPGAVAWLLILSAWSVGGMAVGAPKTPTLRSGKARLEFMPLVTGKPGIGVRLLVQSGRSVALCSFQPAPLAVELVEADGDAAWLTAGYQSISGNSYDLLALGAVTTPHGTQFHFTDHYSLSGQDGTFSLARKVEISSPDPHDRGFSTRYSLVQAAPGKPADFEYFAPGIWYKNSEHLPKGALAADPNAPDSYFREDRMPLPLMMIRHQATGITVSLSHSNGTPSTFAGENHRDRIIDARMQFGSLGIHRDGSPSLVFLFPGTEGDRTYIRGGTTGHPGWAYRSHPVQVGVPHSYLLLLHASVTPDFPSAVRENWKMLYDRELIPIVQADLAKVYRDGMDLLNTYCHEYDGVMSIPFEVRVPDGSVKDPSSQMGFVGQALPAAYLLLKYALETHQPDAADRASRIIDFWVKNSPLPSGLLQTWYDPHPGGTYSWRKEPVYLRIACDGVDGALQAWNVLRQHGRSNDQWLAFCKNWGDWLLAHQNPDGSYRRCWALPGGKEGADAEATDTTDQPIRFLADLYRATGDVRYKAAALRAGEFCWRTVHEAYAYVGGTPDNPNVRDKEAGMMALEAFLALYDMTQDRRWLTAASQAAWYSETWVYCQYIPMPPGDPDQVFPRVMGASSWYLPPTVGKTNQVLVNNRSYSYGLSLIATGHSGADTYMAAAPFLFYRLYLLTGEAHFRDFARMLLYDTKQLLDWDGKLGYAHPGLQTEAMSLAPQRGHGVKSWLPWLTVTQVQPLVRLQDVFGSMSLDDIEALPRKARLQREARFSAARGF